MTKVIILDTETTGVSKTDEVIELAFVTPYTLEEEKYKLEQLFEDFYSDLVEVIESNRYFPSVSIHPRALEVHGITMRDLAGEAKSHTVSLPDEIHYIIGHNISFDKRMLAQSNPDLVPILDKAKYICTLALAKALSKHLNLPFEKHSLDYLAEYFYPEQKDFLILEKHTAKNDVIKTLLVLLKLVEHLPNLETYEDIYNFQTTMSKKK